MAIFDPEGEGIRAFILAGSSTGGGMKGGFSSFVDLIGIVYRNLRLEFASISRTDLIAVVQ